MAETEGVLLVCVSVLRWLGLCFTRIRRSPDGDFVAEDSKFHLVVNVAVIGVFLFAFFQIHPSDFAYAAKVYKSSTTVYPIYTKIMILAIIAFSVCGNMYNRKFVTIINLFVRVSGELERDFGAFRRGKDVGGRRILLGFCGYIGATTVFNLWTDAHLTMHYNRAFRIIHYFCFYCVTLFTAHFTITMRYVRGRFRQVNAAFGRVVAPGRGAPGARGLRRRLRAWTEAYVALRDAEGLTNEVFGKQLCLTLLLAFSSVVVNAYYLITLNMHRTSTPWLNLTMWTGFLQSVIVTLVNTRAAELASDEANRINEIIFNFPVHLHNWEMFDKVKYFVLFSHRFPVKFKGWVFDAVSYDSLLKVMLTSAAVTAIIVQCDFLKQRFRV